MEPVEGRRKSLSRLPQYLMSAMFGSARAVAVVMNGFNLPNGYQHNPESLKLADQANQRGLIYDGPYSL